MRTTVPPRLDVHFKKVVSFKPFDREIRLNVSQTLFSSFDIDIGTKFLLRTIGELRPRRFHSVLDLGCGYGPLGLAMKSLDDETVVHMVDRDALAVDYSRQNAELNGCPDVETYGSLGYDDVHKTDFDLVLSNIPAKAGQPVIAALVRDARHHLARGGLAAIVVVSSLEGFVTDLLARSPELRVVTHRRRRGHAAFHYEAVTNGRGVGPVGFERGVYDRRSVDLGVSSASASLITVHGLSEFESPGHGTELLLEALADLKDRRPDVVLVWDPGQGYAPVAVAKRFQPSVLTLADRDLLALRASKRNLVRNGYDIKRIELRHEVGIPAAGDGRVDAIVGRIREDGDRAALEQLLDRAAGRLRPRGALIVSGSSTVISRLLEHARRSRRFDVHARRRHRGAGLAVLRART